MCLGQYVSISGGEQTHGLPYISRLVLLKKTEKIQERDLS